MRLKDKVAIITGGAYGIGNAFVTGYAAEGARVVIADIDLEKAKDTQKALVKKGHEALALKVDVRTESDIIQMAQKTVEHFGGIDVLVNNAGIVSRGGILSRRTPFYEISMNEWDNIISVNARGSFLCCRAVFPYMKNRDSGKIINIASAQFFTGGGDVKYAHYLASKGAIVGITRALACELGEYNINVNCIAPGSTLSEDDDEALKWRQLGISSRSIKRVEYPHDLVGTAVFLASEESNFITGQTIIVDGGSVFH